MFCTSCGNEIPEGAQFCTSCGAKASSPVTNEAQASAIAGEAQATAVANEAQAAPADDAFVSSQPPASSQQPASAYASKYSTGAPAPQQTPQHTKVMPQVATAAAGEAGVVAQAAPVDNSLRTKKIILAAMIIVILALIVAVICLFSCSRRAVAIDSTNFPNEKIREAVTVGLDIDGDGVLSPEEADAVTGMTFTSTGVQFVTNYNGNDGFEEYKQNWDKDPYPDTGRVSGQSSSSSVYTDPDEEIRRVIEMFPDMQTLAVRGLGLTKLDISKLSKLEYLDCTGNSIISIDLSKNKSLVSMFCDDSVSLTGDDKAGLYYRDLITSVSDSRGSNSTKFAYDCLGRVIKSGDKTFAYDEDGRLTRAQNGTGASDWYEEYKYNADGLLAEAYVYQPLDETKDPLAYVYEYDDKQRLTAYSKEFLSSALESGTIEYSGDQISAIKTKSSNGNGAEANYSVKYGSDKRIEEIASPQESVGGTFQFKYLSDGMCSGWTANERPGNYTVDYSYATTFANGNVPASTTARQSVSSTNASYSFDFTYETNSDGYVTKLIGPSDGSSMLGGTTVNISYVKHVGKLEDLSSQRYVPIYRVENCLSAFGDMTWHLNSDLYSSTGSTAFVSILEDGPMQVTFQALGLAPNLVSNPNEQKLAEYLVEHWGDKMEVKSASTASSKSVQSVSKSSAAVDSARVIQTEYFTFTMPESWVGKVEMERYDYTDSDGENHYYFFKPAGSTQQGCDVLGITVTDDPMAQFGEVSVVGEFKINDRFTGYVDYGNNGIYGGYCPADLASKILSLQSGGQITSPGQQQTDSKIIEAWLKQNVVPNIKAK